MEVGKLDGPEIRAAKADVKAVEVETEDHSFLENILLSPVVQSFNCSNYCDASGYPHASLQSDGQCFCSGTRLWFPITSFHR